MPTLAPWSNENRFAAQFQAEKGTQIPDDCVQRNVMMSGMPRFLAFTGYFGIAKTTCDIPLAQAMLPNATATIAVSPLTFTHSDAQKR